MSVSKNDDAAKLLAKVIDKMDRVLFEHDLQFKPNADWEEFADKVREIIYVYYDDLADEDDPDFDPNAPPTSSSSESASLDGTEDQSEGSRKRKA